MLQLMLGMHSKKSEISNKVMFIQEAHLFIVLQQPVFVLNGDGTFSIIYLIFSTFTVPLLYH